MGKHTGLDQHLNLEDALTSVSKLLDDLSRGRIEDIPQIEGYDVEGAVENLCAAIDAFRAEVAERRPFVDDSAEHRMSAGEFL